ncbi:SMP-30/gluconolactonase/LRE family protein [Bradyrhizobium symbiodeficiens]|uniref:SMP-30/gluconolactonase/LRE family protein n=1 Tax=Bradyrhizobium symbiodeficiens TaxID=1404367 RepID=A0ABX5W697_9BRAD|nr:SMP-30/gluconolactonase/LRE family protein [Bradyrhizobium symbiodeficiens]QDF38814.1 SMP-30/gluconolactonase/LRE family protein [Bradyrhizobium symbiodeficiens]
MLPYVVHEARFAQLVIGHANLEKLATGCRWAEGPAYFAAGRYLVWSDIPNDRLMRFDETDGSVSVFRSPSSNSNGNTVDRQGRLVTCEHLTRRITRTEHDDSITVIAELYQGQRLNSPNDVVVKSDDSIWFSDPTYGIDSDYEGRRSSSQIGSSNVYRVDGTSGEVSLIVSDRAQPNGLAFSPDEATLYVADSGTTHDPNLPATLWSYRLQEASVKRPSLLATCPDGLFDGFRCDIHGNLWTSAGPSVFCIGPDGAHLGTIPVGEMVANVCFGGPQRNRLYICGQTSLYAIYLNTRTAV